MRLLKPVVEAFAKPSHAVFGLAQTAMETVFGSTTGHQTADQLEKATNAFTTEREDQNGMAGERGRGRPGAWGGAKRKAGPALPCRPFIPLPFPVGEPETVKELEGLAGGKLISALYHLTLADYDLAREYAQEALPLLRRLERWLREEEEKDK